jgi:tetratricopeptide (TPR) repeat protein
MKGRWLWLAVLVVLAGGCGKVATEPVDLREKAISLNDMGYEYYRQSRWNLAQEKFDRALTFNRLIDRREGIISNLNNLGAVAQAQGETDKAINYFLEALEVSQDRYDPASRCETLNNLGQAYQSQGHIQEANQAYLRALESADQLPPGPLLALTLTHLGDVARINRDYMTAINYYHQALAADRGTKDRWGQALRHERLGRTFLDLKDHERAELYLNEALREFRRLQNTLGITDTLRDLTHLALARGDLESARINGNLLLGLYRAQGQLKEAEALAALLKRQAGK